MHQILACKSYSNGQRGGGGGGGGGIQHPKSTPAFATAALNHIKLHIVATISAIILEASYCVAQWAPHSVIFTSILWAPLQVL